MRKQSRAAKTPGQPRPAVVIGRGKNRLEIMPPAEPLALFPLRIEYRWIEPGTWELASEARKPRAKAASPRLEVKRVRRRTPELLVRWYPDDVLGHESPDPANGEERGALAEWRAAVAVAVGAGEGSASAWYEMDHHALNAAWQKLVGRLGFFRALHLAREGDAEQPRRSAAIAARPDRVALYALKGRQLVPLGAGGPIPASVVYGPAALADGSWLTDFNRAVQEGMGLRLVGKGAETALAADWLIACGIGSADARNGLDRFFADKISRGDLELVPQDAPSNNSARAGSGWTQWEHDPVEGLAGATWRERRPAAAPPTDADRLAASLGVPAGTLYAARGAQATEGHAAQAMMTALLPGLTLFLDQILAPEGVTTATLNRFLGQHASARGPLPVLRLDHSPYGVLPITTPGALLPPLAAEPAEAAAFTFVSRLAAVTLSAFEPRADQLSVVTPGAGDIGGELQRILQTLPVSSRVEVTDGPADDLARPVTCQLVDGEGDSLMEVKSYLDAFLTRALAELPDPDSRTPGFPLLYRLLRLSLDRIVADLPAALRGSNATEALRLAPAGPASRPLRDWVEAVESLRGRSRAQLEVLLLEVLDVLDHRPDALQTALATCRLRAIRASGVAGLRAGWYGLLARPRRDRATGASDGYLQAPSVPQAETVGLLRSAALRHGAGANAFDLNLSSRRARKALRTLDSLRRGLPLREILGYHAERWLHDNGYDLLLHELREDYAITWSEGATSARAPLLDGERVLAEEAELLRPGPEARRVMVRALLAELRDQEDALADLVVAEAVHQLAHGSLASVNAWMNVLAGGVPPDRVDLVRTHRAGHSSSYRVSFVTEPDAYVGSNPRAIAEPAVAALAETYADGFRRARVRVTITTPLQAVPVTRRLTIALSADLGLDAVDLLVGGIGEVTTRIRAHVLRVWDDELAEMLGQLPARGIEGFLNERRPLDIDSTYRSGTAPSLDELLTALQPLKDLLASGRPLAPGDLAAAAPPAGRGLDAATLLPLLATGVAALRARAETLLTVVDDVRGRLGTAAGAVASAAAELRRQDALPNPPGAAARAALVYALDGALSDASAVIEEVARFGVPQATSLETAVEVAEARERYAVRIAALERRMGEKHGALTAAIATAQAAPATVQARAAVLRRLVAALQEACDGEGIAIWPPFDIVAETTPDVGQPRQAAAALGDWPRARGRLRGAQSLAATIPTLRIRATAHTPTTDPRRPAISYLGLHLLPNGDLPGGVACGWVLDEWSDFRPATTQRTGVAVNYDSPQSEPPHAVLLGVPPNDAVTAWTEPLAAALVQEAIRLMRFRALPAHLARYGDMGLGVVNLVPPREENGRGRHRVPTPPKLDPTKTSGRAYGWKVGADTPGMARTARRARERRTEEG